MLNPLTNLLPLVNPAIVGFWVVGFIVDFTATDAITAVTIVNPIKTKDTNFITHARLERATKHHLVVTVVLGTTKATKVVRINPKLSTTIATAISVFTVIFDYYSHD